MVTFLIGNLVPGPRNQVLYTLFFLTGVIEGFLFLLNFPHFKNKNKKWQLRTKPSLIRDRFSKTRKPFFLHILLFLIVSRVDRWIREGSTPWYPLDWDIVSYWVILRRRVHGNYGHSSSLSGIWHRLFWDLRFVNWTHNKKIYNSRMEKIVLEGW